METDSLGPASQLSYSKHTTCMIQYVQRRKIFDHNLSVVLCFRELHIYSELSAKFISADNDSFTVVTLILDIVAIYNFFGHLRQSEPYRTDRPP